MTLSKSFKETDSDLHIDFLIGCKSKSDLENVFRSYQLVPPIKNPTRAGYNSSKV